MTGRTTFFAPAHTPLKRQALGNSGADPSAAPSHTFLGGGIQDHRMPYGGRGASPTQAGIIGWYGFQPFVADYVPSTLAPANIAPGGNATSGQPIPLVTTSGAGITVLAAPTSFLPNPIRGAGGGQSVFGTATQNIIPAGSVVIDGVPQVLSFGTMLGSFNTGFYDPGTCVGRAVSVTGAAGGTGGAILVSGYDTYGFPLREQITAAAGATVNGHKAFKAISSVVPQFTDAHTYSVGTADVYGIGLFTRRFSHLEIEWNEALVTTNTGFVAADTTNPATNVTGDVRGTYAVQSASNGTNRLVITCSPSIADLAGALGITQGLFGVPQNLG